MSSTKKQKLDSIKSGPGVQSDRSRSEEENQSITGCTGGFLDNLMR